MTPNQPQEPQGVDERAFIAVAGATGLDILAKRYADMLRVAGGTEAEKFAALAAFAQNGLARDNSKLWASLGAVGQSAMSAAIDTIADEKGVEMDTRKVEWKAIRDRNKAQEETPAAPTAAPTAKPVKVAPVKAKPAAPVEKKKRGK